MLFLPWPSRGIGGNELDAAAPAKPCWLGIVGHAAGWTVKRRHTAVASAGKRRIDILGEIVDRQRKLGRAHILQNPLIDANHAIVADERTTRVSRIDRR